MEANRARPSRTDRYMARVVAQLSAMPDHTERRYFICGELEKWEERYARFIQSEGESHRRGDTSGQPTAFDFVETIAALDAMQAVYTESEAA
jgi:hypothetical protein